jgi:hypothetical protein
MLVGISDKHGGQEAVLTRAIPVFVLRFLFNAASLYFMVLGSGVLTVTFWRLVVIAASLSFAPKLAASFIRRRTTLILAGLMILGVLGSGMIFMHFITTGFHTAKVFGSKVSPQDVSKDRKEDRKWLGPSLSVIF